MARYATCARRRLASPYGGGEGPLSHGLRRDSNKLRSNCHRQLFHSIRCATHRPKGGAKGAVRHPAKSQFFAEPTGRGAQWRQYVMPTFVTNCLQAQPGRGAQGQLYLVPNVCNALAAGPARQLPIFPNPIQRRSVSDCQKSLAEFAASAAKKFQMANCQVKCNTVS